MKTTRKFITYYFPGSFVSESCTDRCESFDIPKEIPRDCYGFQFHETDYMIEGKEEFVGKTRTQDALHLIGEIIHADAIPETSETRILISNIRGNSPTHQGVKTQTGTWQSYDEHTVVHSPSEFKIIAPRLYKNFGKKSA